MWTGTRSVRVCIPSIKNILQSNILSPICIDWYNNVRVYINAKGVTHIYKEGAMLLHLTHTEPWRLLSRVDNFVY